MKVVGVQSYILKMTSSWGNILCLRYRQWETQKLRVFLLTLFDPEIIGFKEDKL